MKKIIFPILIPLLMVVFFSCNKHIRYETKGDATAIKVSIHRFDQALIHLDKKNIDISTRALYRLYPGFIDSYVNEILNLDASDTTKVTKMFQEFLSDTIFSSVNRKTLQVFDNITDIEQNLSSAFTNLHYFFPEVKIPEVYFFVSGFNRSILVNKNWIGVGADLFLGSDYPQYQNFTYQYLIKNMKPQQITPFVVSALLYNNFSFNPSNDRLLENILYRGKILFLLSKLMPNEFPNTIMGYEKREWEWCRKYENQIWETVIDKNDLFSTDVMLIHKYIDEAPFTTPVSQDAPGRIGIWLGWQIIESYMENNNEVGLKDLMLNNNYQQIFDQSGYKP